MNGLQQTLADTLQYAIRMLMNDVCGNPLLLNEVVAGGKLHFRPRFKRLLEPLPTTNDLADRIWLFFEKRAGGQLAAYKFLDTVEVETPETDAEREKRIDDAWELVSHSSEAAKRLHGTPTRDVPIPLKYIRGGRG